MNEMRTAGRIYLALLSMAIMHGVNKNVSHAKTMGMSEALNIDDDQWSTLLMSFFIGIVLSMVMSAIFCAQRSVDRLLAYSCALSILSGCTTASVGLTLYLFRSSGHAWIWLVITRGVQGLCEGAATVCMLRYCSSMFDASQIGSNIMILLSLPAISATVGAIYASAMIHVRTGKFMNWQLLYFGKGLFTIVFSTTIWVLFFSAASNLKGLTVQDNEKGRVSDPMRRLFQQPAAWQWLLINFFLGVPLTTIVLYAPQLVQAVGFSPGIANLLAIFPYMAATSVFVLHLYVKVSDGGVQLLIAIQFVGFVIYRSAKPQTSKVGQVMAYSATIFMTCGLGATSALLAKGHGAKLCLRDRQLYGLCSAILSQATGLLTSWTFRGNGSLNNDVAIAAIAIAFLISCLQRDERDERDEQDEAESLPHTEKPREQSVSTVQS